MCNTITALLLRICVSCYQCFKVSLSLSLCLFRPVSSFLHISSSCSSYSYWSCHLSALSAFESTGTAAFHSVLPSGHSALHELHSLLPQVRLWWTWKWGTKTKASFDSQYLSSHKNIFCHVEGNCFWSYLKVRLFQDKPKYVYFLTMY